MCFITLSMMRKQNKGDKEAREKSQYEFKTPKKKQVRYALRIKTSKEIAQKS